MNASATINYLLGFHADTFFFVIIRVITDIVKGSTGMNSFLGFHVVVWVTPAIFTLFTKA